MKPKLLLGLALVLSGGLVGCSNTASLSALGNSTVAEAGTVLSMDEALATARAYVKKRGIDVSKHYIDSARLDLNRRGDRGKFWLITWLRNEYANDIPIKGGQTYVHVYMDKSVEIFYGE